MPVLIGGFTLQTGVAIDDRFVISASSERFDFSSGLLYEGLTVYATGSQEYFLFVSASTYDTDASASSWREIITSNPGTNDVNITGQLDVFGIGDISASIAALEAGSGVRDLLDVTNQGAYTNITITASAGIIVPDLYPMGGTGAEGNAPSINSGRINIKSAGDLRVGAQSIPDSSEVTGGLAISGGVGGNDFGNINQSPAISVLNSGYLSFNRIRNDIAGNNINAAFIKFDGSAASSSNEFLITGSVFATEDLSGSFSKIDSASFSPKFIIDSASTETLNITYHTETTDNFIALSGSGAKLEDLTSFPTASEGALIVKNGVLYIGVTD
jgi:hypothetical protein